MKREALSQKANQGVIPANELNDPLQTILSNTEAVLLLLSRSNPDIDKIKEALEHVISEVGRVRQMIRGDIEPLRASSSVQANLTKSGNS